MSLGFFKMEDYAHGRFESIWKFLKIIGLVWGMEGVCAGSILAKFSTTWCSC